MKPTECQVARMLKAGNSHWVVYENDLGDDANPFVMNAGFPTTEDAVDLHLHSFNKQNVKIVALKELYEAS